MKQNQTDRGTVVIARAAILAAVQRYATFRTETATAAAAAAGADEAAAWVALDGLADDGTLVFFHGHDKHGDGDDEGWIHVPVLLAQARREGDETP